MVCISQVGLWAGQGKYFKSVSGLLSAFAGNLICKRGLQRKGKESKEMFCTALLDKEKNSRLYLLLQSMLVTGDWERLLLLAGDLSLSPPLGTAATWSGTNGDSSAP